MQHGFAAKKDINITVNHHLMHTLLILLLSEHASTLLKFGKVGLCDYVSIISKKNNALLSEAAFQILLKTHPVPTSRFFPCLAAHHFCIL